MTNRFDRFGFYQVDTFKTYSKVEAILLSEKTGKKVVWHYNDTEFESIDWKIEPTRSLSDLYALRARQIRERYDYIVLFYSGGADSHNMVRAFLDNDLHIDEIASFWSEEGDSRGAGHDSHFNHEIATRAIPSTIKILDTHPHIKHRVIDLSQTISKIYDDPSRKFDFIYQMNNMYSPNHYARSLYCEQNEDYRNIINQGKSLCFVYGGDKPRLFQRDGRYCVQFIDMIDHFVSPRVQMLSRTCDNFELFYWTPDLPQLVSKQAHTVMKYLKLVKCNGNVSQNMDFVPGPNAQFKSFGSIQEGQQIFYLNNHGIHKLIYGIGPTPTIKPNNVFYGLRDVWFHSRPEQFIGARNFRHGIDKLFDLVPDPWFVKGKTAINGITSQPYFLE